jgi:hypothetical protein
VTFGRPLLPSGWLLIPSLAAAAGLHIEVQDERGRPAWTRLEVRNQAGEEFQAPGAFHENMTKARGGKPFCLGSFIVHGNADLGLSRVPIP